MLHDLSPIAPAKKTAAVTPSDGVDLPETANSLLVLVTGNLSFVAEENDVADAVPAFAVTAGMVIPVRVRRVMATGTTATVLALLV